MRVQLIRLAKIVFSPIKRVGRTLVNIMALEVATIIYQKMKRKLYQDKSEKDDFVLNQPKFKRRRW